MLLPAKALLSALALWLLLAIASALWPALQPLNSAAGASLLLWAAIDWLRARAEPLPAAQRVVNATLAVGESAVVELRFHFTQRTPARFEAFDHHPPYFKPEGLPALIETQGHNAQALRYRVRPLARGDHSFGHIEVRIPSPWGAWLRQAKVGSTEPVRVYPNFAPLARHALRAVDYRNARFGLQQRRRRGQGMDFSQLREYREGDSMRQIDWKATTRMGKMISREYQDERDQRILLMIDCGRRMAAKEGGEFALSPRKIAGQPQDFSDPLGGRFGAEGANRGLSPRKIAGPPQGFSGPLGGRFGAAGANRGLSHFDHALDTALMLAYVALNHGDRVGLLTLGGPERYLPAQHSATTTSRILRETYDLQPTLQVSDFERAAQQLLLRERKRALVVLLTNLRDEDDQGLIAATRLLSARHLVLVASLREAALDAVQEENIHDAFDAARVAAAVDYARRRETTLRRLRAEGVLCLDVRPQDLAIETVNRYLAVKAASRL